MTYSVVPALRKQPELAEEWSHESSPPSTDPRQLPAAEKEGSLFGMGMTEKQGGSDVRANTVARPLNGGGRARSTRSPATSGSSAPQCDAFLAGPGRRRISCFLMPRRLPDGSSTGFACSG